MTKVAFVINYMRNCGPSNVVKTLLQCLDKREITPILITLYNKNDEEMIKDITRLSIQVFELNYSSKFSCILKSTSMIEHIVESKNIDILHSHTFMSDMIVFRTRVKARKITTIHNRIYEDYGYLFGNIMGTVIAKMHLSMLKHFDKCVCCSQSVNENISKYLKNTTFVQNGISVPKSKNKMLRKDLGIPSDSLIYIYIGSLSARKNVEQLIKLFRDNCKSNEYLLILGAGKKFDDCLKLCNSRTMLMGFVENPSSYYEISDVYVSASQSEGLSLSQLESLECNLAQLVSNIPSHREVVYRDKGFYVGEVFDEANFKIKLQNLRNNIKSGSIQSKALYERYFTGEIMSKNYQDIYRQWG